METHLKLFKGQKTSNYQNPILLWNVHQHMIPDQLAWCSMNQSKQKKLSAKGQVIQEVSISSSDAM
jgi:hypothetical protein